MFLSKLTGQKYNYKIDLLTINLINTVLYNEFDR